MSRYAHYIAAAKECGLPGSIVAVEVDYTIATNGSGKGANTVVWGSWYGAGFSNDKGIMGKVSLWQGSESSSIWKHFLRLAAKNRTAWIVSSATRSLICYLRLWHELGTVSGWTLEGHTKSGRYTRQCRFRETNPCLILESPPTVVVLRHTQYPGRLTILDSRNWGIEQCHLGDTPQQRSVSLCTAIRDMIDIVKYRHMGGLKCTASSQGFHSWRCKHMVLPVYCHRVKTAEKLERQGLYGGRCECYCTGEVRQRLYHLDVRSMYPAICLAGKTAAKLLRTGTGTLPRFRQGTAATSGFIAYVRVTTDVPGFPKRRGPNTVYPTGQFWTTLAGEDLQHARESGCIDRVSHWAEYQLTPLLRFAIDDWYTVRMQADAANNRAVSAWSKAVMCGLIGKFAQRNKAWDYVDGHNEGIPYGEWYARNSDGEVCRYRAIDWQVYREVDTGLADDSSPAVTAFITAAGRQLLWRILCECPPGSAYYCDTDSVIVDETCYQLLCKKGMVRNGEIGYLQIREVADYARFYGPKHYRFGDSVVHGGHTTCPDCNFGSVFALSFSTDGSESGAVRGCDIQDTGSRYAADAEDSQSVQNKSVVWQRQLTLWED